MNLTYKYFKKRYLNSLNVIQKRTLQTSIRVRLPSLVLLIGNYRNAKKLLAIWDLVSVMQKCFLNYLLGIGFRSLLLHCHARRGRDCLVAD